mgnify:CR=1 FL=1
MNLLYSSQSNGLWLIFLSNDLNAFVFLPSHSKGIHMKTSTPTDPTSNVVQLFDYQQKAYQDRRLLRVSAECDGLSMLYSNHHTNSDKLYSMKVLCWALQANGDVVGIVPWLNKASPCQDLDDPYYGKWQGYYDPKNDQLFFEPPEHKVLELQKAVQYFGEPDQSETTIHQEIPDTIGTHAMLSDTQNNGLILTDILSWRLYGDGHLDAMIIDEQLVDATPILVGDPCLYPVSANPDFRYFFQHHIANQIKAQDPDSMAAIELLLDR